MIMLPCELGQRFTGTFIEVDATFERLHWYFFPIKVQRILPTISIALQKPIVIGCFGLVEFSRDEFKKVCKPINANLSSLFVRYSEFISLSFHFSLYFQ